MGGRIVASEKNRAVFPAAWRGRGDRRDPPGAPVMRTHRRGKTTRTSCGASASVKGSASSTCLILSAGFDVHEIYQEGDPHWTARGHQVVAEILYEQTKDLLAAAVAASAALTARSP